MTRRQRICLIAGIIFGLAHPFALQIASAAEPKRVLLLYYSFGGNLVNALHFRAALEQQSQEILEIYDAPLNTARPANEDVVARYADYLHALLPDQRLDLVVAVGGLRREPLTQISKPELSLHPDAGDCRGTSHSGCRFEREGRRCSG